MLGLAFSSRSTSGYYSTTEPGMWPCLLCGHATEKSKHGGLAQQTGFAKDAEAGKRHYCLLLVLMEVIAH
jgi:hypothetical protein